MEALALVLGPAIVGLLTRRWEAVGLAAVAWPAYAIGRNQGWWGCCGTGDGWQAYAAAFTMISVAGTAGAIWLGRFVAGRHTNLTRPQRRLP